MEMYFLKSAACLAILMLFYKLLLEKESMHTFKRFYLLMAPLISFGIPFISFPEYVTPSSEGTAFFSEAAMAVETSRFPVFEVLLGTIYFTGVLFFGSRFLYNFRSLLKRARNNPKVKTADATHVLLKDPVNPHTFWNYIYLNRKKYDNKEIPQEVLDHELAHVKQKHSADILFMELLQALLWFLPLIYLLKKSVKLNHEFLADRAVLQKAENISLYQQILLSFSSGEPNELVNSINYQSIKKRFTVMKTQTSKKSVLFRTFLFLPLLAFLLYSFSGRETVILQNKTEAVEFFQEKATPKMIAEYNRLVKHYNSMPREKQMIKQEDINRIMYILSLLTPEQKEKAEKIKFDVPPPPAPKVSKNGDIPMPPPPPPAPPATKGGTVPPPPAPPVVGKGGDVPIPPPPPPSPIEAVKGWIEEGAEFYLNGTKVSGKEALQAVQENNGKNLSVQVQDSGSGKTVRISDNKR